MRQFERLGTGVGFGESEKSASGLDLIPAAT